MSQMQKFLYSYASKPLEGDKQREELLSEKGGDDAILQRKPICVDRFDELRKQSDIHAEDYGSCIYYDVEPEAFWEFLYSDEWDDSVILRVFPGELYTNLDRMLHEMLKDNRISRHETCAYLKESSHKNTIKFDYAPETVRIEFTYYGKNLDRGSSSMATFTPNGSISETLKNLVSNSEKSIDSKDSTNAKSDKLWKNHEEYDLLAKHEHLMATPVDKQMINISMAHFHCLNPQDIKENVDSEYDVLEINLQRCLGQDVAEDEKNVDHLWQKIKTRFVRKKDLCEDSHKDEDKDSEEEEEERDGDSELKQRERQKKLLQRKLELEMMDAEKRAEFYTSFFQSQELLMPAISTEIGLRTMGRILEEEKYLKFDKMSLRTRKRFFLTDTRILAITKKLLKGKPKRAKKTKFKEKNSSSRQKGKSDPLFKRIHELSNLYEFALVVLGITDSYVLYRLILYPKQQKGKWNQDFEEEEEEEIQSKRRPKKLEAHKNPFLREMENRISGMKPKSAKKNIESLPIRNTKRENMAGVDSKHKGDIDKTGIKYQRRPCLHYNIDKVRKGMLWFAEFTSRVSGVERKGVSQERQKRELEKRNANVQGSDSEQQSYYWEIHGDNGQVGEQAEFDIPNFSLRETRVQSEKIINAMDNFIIRKERITSSKGPTSVSLAFIRPSFVTKLFQE